MKPPLDSRLVMIGMDKLEPSPASQILRGVAEVVDCPPVQVVKLALRRTAPHECRDRLDQQTKLTLAPAKRFFGALTVFDVGVDAVPFDDLTVVITQRAGPEQKPSIFAVVPAQPRFRLSWC